MALAVSSMEYSKTDSGCTPFKSCHQSVQLVLKAGYICAKICGNTAAAMAALEFVDDPSKIFTV